MAGVFFFLPETVEKNCSGLARACGVWRLCASCILFSPTGILYLSHATTNLWPVWLNPLSPSILNLHADLRKSFPISNHLFSLALPTPSATTSWWWSVQPPHAPVTVLGLWFAALSGHRPWDSRRQKLHLIHSHLQSLAYSLYTYSVCNKYLIDEWMNE